MKYVKLNPISLQANKTINEVWIHAKVLNFAVCLPRKAAMHIAIRLPQSEELDNELVQHDLDLLEYDKGWKAYRMRLSVTDIAKHHDFLQGLLKQAFDLRNAD